MPDSFSLELRSLLTGLLQRDVHKRLGCRGRGAEEIKSHPFFRGIDWRVVFLQRLPPPLIPARGEVNAADAFDIGSFDDEDTKHIKLTEADQELYRNFPVVVSERWQHEIAETIFDYINHEADKAEMKRKNKHKLGYQEEEQSDCILHGYIKRLGGTFTATWLTRYVRLYPNRLELWSDSGKQPELIFMDQIEEVCNDYVQIKNEQCIVIKLYNHSKYVLTNSDEIGLKEWHVSLKAAHKESLDMMTTMAEKATKIYGTEIPLKHMGKRRQQLLLEANSNSAIANLEQKIIQKELQASSRSPELAAAAAAAEAAATASKPHLKGVENVCPALSSGLYAPPVGAHSHGQVPGSSSVHKHHRGHHQHRAHHHRHHHHSKHPPAWSMSGSAAPLGHHHHARHSGRHIGRSANQFGVQPVGSPTVAPTCDRPSQASARQTAPAKSQPEVVQTHDSISAVGKLPSAPAASEQGRRQVGAMETSDQRAPREDIATSPVVPGREEQQQQHHQEANKLIESTSNVQQSNSIDSSSSGRSASCSTSSEASGEEVAMPEEDEQSEDEERQEQGDPVALATTTATTMATTTTTIATTTTSSTVSAATATTSSAIISTKAAERTETEPVQGDHTEAAQRKTESQVDLQVSAASLDKPAASEQGGSGVSLQYPDLNRRKEQEQTRPRLALSLENVSEHQEVLRDPSKRITSDNKQREQDLVAQYEKLNIGACNSSSSIEEEPAN